MVKAIWDRVEQHDVLTRNRRGCCRAALLQPLIEHEFPSYEAFWLKHVQQVNKGDHDVCIAQLHYTILVHMAQADNIRRLQTITSEQLFEGVTCLTSAQDVAFELLERYQNPTRYDPWLPKKRGGKVGGREARWAWQEAESHPLQDVRDYRNHLIHGGLYSKLMVDQVLHVPKIGKEQHYVDWRVVREHPSPASLVGDFVPALDVLKETWTKTVQYLERAWQTHLL